MADNVVPSTAPKPGAASSPGDWESRDIKATYDFWYKMKRDELMKKATFNLPICPSANNCWLNLGGKGRKGRARTPHYNKWIDAAGWMVKAQRTVKIEGMVAVSIQCPRIANADIDNRIKPVLDLLVKMDVIDDDRDVEQVTAAWTDKGDLMEITVEGVE